MEGQRSTLHTFYAASWKGACLLQDKLLSSQNYFLELQLSVHEIWYYGNNPLTEFEEFMLVGI